ncbi:hypothetical protein [Natrononativus amylolyticus]|uniref:hypothetical protein n=1 Tax=Natrononativus amylolyticus TaxID=2963434 RepID=UPI0020CE93D5|nr:hypothetical protein [Natrononativus amylolyticus]
MTEPPPLEGTLKLCPVPHPELLSLVSAEYATLAEAYGARNVLVVKRHPAGLERVQAALASAAGPTGAPRLESLPEHASKVLEEYDPTLERLEYEERIELISLVIDGAKRDRPRYLERARRQESFARDVGQLLLEVTRQRLRRDDLEEPHPCLDYLYAINERFHAEIADRGFVERADVVPRAVDLLEADTDGVRSRVCSSFDAVLALEFEEFRELDRRYLAALAGGAELVCLGERHASVERTRVEPGRLDDLADGLTVEVLDRADAASRQPLTRFLATGESSGLETRAEPARAIRRIRARTAREQSRRVVTEIQSLRDEHDWRYDDVAVAVARIERVPEVRKRLREAGLPTAAVGTTSLAEDPAVNELYAFVVLNCERRADDPEIEIARRRLEARVPGFSPALLEECADASVSRSLQRWIVRTDLKGRIAADADWVDAREQFESVRRILEIARFVERTDLVAPDWQGLARMLRNTIEYDAPYVHAVETDAPAGGVAVCPIDDLKYDSREAVFLLDLTDDNYPGEQFLTQLFPTAWLKAMPAYPAVTNPSAADVVDTFAPVADLEDVGDPFEHYHAQRSRRRLAIGSRAARTALYCCSYERDDGGLRRTHEESRYLRALEAAPGLSLEDVETHARAAIYGEANALVAVLEEPRGELERVLREASTGGEADLAETEALFEEIAVLLAEGDVDDDLVEAVRSQFEFAAGEVIRRE